MRRRTNAYTFDQDLHRQWVAGGGVWLDENNGNDDDSSNPSTDFPPSSATREDAGDTNPDVDCGNPSLEKSTCVNARRSFHTRKGTDQPVNGVPGISQPVCNPTGSEGSRKIIVENPGNFKQGEHAGDSGSSHGSKCVEGMRNVALISAHDYKPLDLPERTPCYMCGRRDSRYVEKLTPERKKRPLEQQDARRICLHCYQEAVERARASAPPLSGVIDYARMEPVTSSIGRCSVCGLEKAEWIDRGSGVRLCGECFRRGQANTTDKMPPSHRS
ncbi:MAG: hypothetical protein A4E38_01880 [Methanoregulaceae archaeon PtaB.Bin108]|nr:MAG: hypothetical protein A4E38_01880 [Methanoregulaceae archaeon PtaB.Bin108]